LVKDHQLSGQVLSGWTFFGNFSLRANAIERGLQKGNFCRMKNPCPGSMMTDHNTLHVLCELLSPSAGTSQSSNCTVLERPRNKSLCCAASMAARGASASKLRNRLTAKQWPILSGLNA
jgi:hypothetical protein